jgi:mRNA-degrading endonuclease YafQ of YafQ-DinJ toxin-antitoxin module
MRFLVVAKRLDCGISYECVLIYKEDEQENKQGNARLTY